MTEPAPLPEIAPAEYEARLARAQSAMAERSLAGLLLTSAQELRWFTGFQTPFWQSPARPWFLFVPASGKPVAIIPRIGGALMARSWIDDIRTWNAPDPADDGISLLHELLHPLARNRAEIGIPKGAETVLRMPLADYERLRAGLPGLRIADATGIIRALRMTKSPAEIARIARICTIVGRSFDAVPDLAPPGLPLAEAFRAFRRDCLARGADDVPYLVGGAGPGGYGDVISPPGRHALAAGDVLMLDTGATLDGYFCDFDRNWAIGRADDAARRAHDVLWRATEAGIEAARPGVLARVVFAAMRSVIGGESGGDVGRMGHGIGLALTEWPSISPADETMLAEGMVLAIEPSLGYGDGCVMVHEENIVVTDGRARLLTERAPPELPVI